jgi:heme/copper-type cytochrome/quinol oxidase subunit 4
MPTLVKTFIAAVVLTGISFLISMTQANDFSLEARVIGSLVVGVVQFVVWTLIIRSDQRRGTPEPYVEEDDEADA